MKRIATAVVALVALAVGVGTAVAGGNGATIETFPVSFTITSAQCQYLPSGTTIVGSGIEKSITRVQTAKDGTTRIGNTSNAHGTATDQAGNAYQFEYSNTFNISNTTANLAVFSGQMSDHFSLAGLLSNGFVGTFTTDFTTFATITPKVSHGDPIDFNTLEAHCDPL